MARDHWVVFGVLSSYRISGSLTSRFAHGDACGSAGECAVRAQSERFVAVRAVQQRGAVHTFGGVADGCGAA